MTEQDIFNHIVDLHDRWLANPTPENLAAFVAARDAWFAKKGGSDDE